MDSLQLSLWADLSTSSPGLADGPSLSASPASPTTPRSGPALAPASLSRRPESVAAPTTCAICGRSCGTSSPSACLQLSLGSRLQAQMAGLGSPLYALTWKTWAMQSGPPICALRASARRTSDSASTGAASGWATPVCNDAKGSTHCYGPVRPDGTRAHYLKLPGEAALSGWPTPTAADQDRGARSTSSTERGPTLTDVVGLADPKAEPLFGRWAGWATPTARDWRDGRASEATMGRNGRPLNEQAVYQLQPDTPARLTADGRILTGSDAGMDGGGQLNPAHSRWLQGYPAVWDSCGATETPSSRRSRRSS